MSAAILKFSWVEVKLFIREPLTVGFSLAFPLILLYVLAEVFGNQPDPDVYRGVGPIDFYLAAYIGLATAAVAFIGIPTHLAAYRESGVLRRFQASALSVSTVFAAQIIVAYLLSIASSLVLIAFVVIVYEPSMPKNILGAIGAFVLGVTSLSAIGLFLGAVLPSPRTAQLAGMILFFVMMIIGGPGPPVEILPALLENVSEALPLTHVVTLIQDPWLGFGWNLTETGIVVGMMVLGFALAWRLFRWE